MTKCDIIKNLELTDYQKWVESTVVKDMFTVVGVNKRLDQSGEIKDVELVLSDNKTGKETSIYLTDYSCSNGLLEGEWQEHIMYLVGEKKYYKSRWTYFDKQYNMGGYASMYGDDDLNV